MDKKQISKVISAIQAKSNKKYPSVFKDEVANAEMVEIIDRMQDEDDIPKWKKEYYLRKRPVFAEVKQVLDEDLAKKKNGFVEDEISKAISEGRLPKKLNNIYENTKITKSSKDNK